MPRHVLIVGLGATGRAVAATLGARGVRVRAVDRRPDVEALPGVERRDEAEGPTVLDDIDLVVPSPGVPRDAPLLTAAVRAGIAVESEIEVAMGLLRCPIVAITGTNGKSTTTALVGAALAESGLAPFVGGNLGTPLVTAADGQPGMAVAEVSSFQLEWVRRFRPRIGCLLNVTPDHLDRHGTLEAYRDTKARLFAAQGPGDVAVINRDDPVAWSVAEGLAAEVVSFGTRPTAAGAFAGEGSVVLRLPGRPEERYELGRTRLVGRHNLENVLAAATVARLAGASAAAVQAAIDGFEPLPHRMARVAVRRGVGWWNDSKATNVGAAVRSLESCAGPVILLAGGVDKGGSYAPLADVAAVKVRLAIVFGAAQARIAEALGARGVATEPVATLEAAVARAAVAAVPGDSVLLAPACASFDMFTDYAARGRAFVAAVEALP